MNIFSYVKEHLSILEVIGEYTTLKKIGSHWTSHCPFHHEKTASFMVNEEKEIFYCFGCHIGGDLIKFVAKAENYSHLEAVHHLIERYKVAVPDHIANSYNKKAQNNNRRQEIYNAVADWCHQNLLKQAYLLNYLHKRGFTDKSISTFCIGSFPGGLESVRQFIAHMKNNNILLKDLIEENILVRGKTVIYSPFEDRIMFPIYDHLNRICGFGGRIIKSNDSRPKYYNSRENSQFVKGNLLFGLHLAKKTIQESGKVFLVEGYTDCIAMQQHGFINTVATLGTACTLAHLKQLSRYAHELIIIYDGDVAGQNALLRLGELCWEVNIELYVISLPVEEDPASLLAKKQSLDPYIQTAQDIFDFLVDSIVPDFSTKPLAHKLEKIRIILQKMKGIEDPIKKDLLLQRMSKSINIPLSALKEQLELISQPKQSTKKEENVHADKKEGPTHATLPSLEKNIFCAIINNIKLFNKNKDTVQQIINYLPSPLSGILIRVKEYAIKEESINFSRFFDELADTEKEYVSALLLEYDQDIDEDTFEQMLNLFQKKQWKSITQTMKTALLQAKRQGDTKKAEEILQEFLSLREKRFATMFKKG